MTAGKKSRDFREVARAGMKVVKDRDGPQQNADDRACDHGTSDEAVIVAS